MKKFKIYSLISICSLLLLAGCEKDGELVVKPVKALKPFEIIGYAVSDTLEQYFDGIKIRDYYGRVSLANIAPQLAFENDVTVMQFKKKSTGEVVYEQKFNLADDNNVVPKFYFDGAKVSTKYEYPKAQGTEYLVNFYVEALKGVSSIDISTDVLEYYYDNNKLVIVNVTSFPIATNVQPGKWTSYFTLQPPPTPSPTRQGTEFYPVVALKDSKTKKYLINNNSFESSIQMEIPDQYAYQGKTQSMHISGKLNALNALYFEVNDLIQMFP